MLDFIDKIGQSITGRVKILKEKWEKWSNDMNNKGDQKPAGDDQAGGKPSTAVKETSKNTSEAANKALFDAIEKGSLKEVEDALKGGADVNARRDKQLLTTPLHTAVHLAAKDNNTDKHKNHMDVLDFILNHDEINIVAKNKDNLTVLDLQHNMDLESFPHAEQVRMLIIKANDKNNNVNANKMIDHYPPLKTKSGKATTIPGNTPPQPVSSKLEVQ